MQQIFAARLAGSLLRVRYSVKFTDMSPFRAIRSELLRSLPMREETYGWNLEMQMLVAQRGARILEIPVNHRRRRGGVSKVSGTFSRNDSRGSSYGGDILPGQSRLLLNPYRN